MNDDLVVFDSLRKEIMADLPYGEPSLVEQLTLPIENVLVEDDQARTRSRVYSESTYCPA